MVDHLSELRAAGERATPGPWAVTDDLYIIVRCVPDKREKRGWRGENVLEADESDTPFIALARNNWDALLDVVESAEALFETRSADPPQAPGGVVVLDVSQTTGSVKRLAAALSRLNEEKE